MTVVEVQTRRVSPTENCGFVIHFISFPIAILTILWVSIPDDTLHAWDISYYPHKSWAIFLPIFAMGAFFATPLLYAAINIMISPKIESVMWDDFSRIPNAHVVVVAAPNSAE